MLPVTKIPFTKFSTESWRLASHWPCVTDSSGLSTYGLNGLWKGDEHPTYTASEYGPPLSKEVICYDSLDEIWYLNLRCYICETYLLTYTLLLLCSRGHRPIVSIQLCLVMPPLSSTSCTWNVLSHFFHQISSSSAFVSLFCGL